jgi:DNA repair protein RecO (recombination protein O)
MEDDALVLKIYPYAESDAVVVVLTRHSGKLRLVCRGLKRPKNALHGIVSPFNLVFLRFSGDDPQQLGRMFDASLLQGFNLLPDRLSDYYFLSHVAEVLLSVEIDPQCSPRIFRLVQALVSSVETRGYSRSDLIYFYFWLLRLEGWHPDVGICGRCHEAFTPQKPPVFFEDNDLAIVCNGCRRPGEPSARQELEELVTLQQAMLKLAPDRITLSEQTIDIISSYILRYSRKITDITGKKYKSLSFIQ